MFIFQLTRYDKNISIPSKQQNLIEMRMNKKLFYKCSMYYFIEMNPHVSNWSKNREYQYSLHIEFSR